ncbi:hypothetical protein Y032_0001g404 [Ancylostoma ceylanicum]|uniref:GIY-YIG domain-containing protein n=2 Tax=Ancylostoma ceylanicum TaxID=53326 RepID=A0A016W3J3_9BILA|nr:hypothetical protein Y032_0001g404 [Ancylostoma ceylanicum]
MINSGYLKRVYYKNNGGEEIEDDEAERAPLLRSMFESKNREEYIGETGRALNIRIKEHLASKKRRSLTLPLGKHRVEAHDGNDFCVKCNILTYEAEVSA